MSSPTYPRFNKPSKNQTKDNASLPSSKSNPTPDKAASSPAPNQTPPPQKVINATSQSPKIDWLDEKIKVETRARETEQRLSKRISELESENNQLKADNARLSEESFEMVGSENSNSNDTKIEDLLNKIEILKESCDHLEQQNSVLLQEKEVATQKIQRLDSHVSIFAENLSSKEAETAQLLSDFNRMSAENSQLQEENNVLEKENHRLQENLLFQPTTQKEQINELKLQNQQLSEAFLKLQEDNDHILSNNQILDEQVRKLLSEITNLREEASKLHTEKLSINNNFVDTNSKFQEERDKILSHNSNLAATITNLQEDNAQLLSHNKNLNADISKLREKNIQILSNKTSSDQEIAKLQEENSKIISINNNFAVDLHKLQEENAQLQFAKNSLEKEIHDFQKDNAQRLSENENLVQEITKLREEIAKISSQSNKFNDEISNLRAENTKILSSNTQLSDENEVLTNRSKQLDAENQHLQNQKTEVDQAYQKLKEENDLLQQVLDHSATNHSNLITTKNTKDLHEIRPILAQFNGLNSNITTTLQDDLNRLQKLLETFGSVKGAGKEVNMDQGMLLWHEYIDNNVQSKILPKNTLSAALTRRVIETILDAMANGVPDLEMTDVQDLEFRILRACDTLTDLVLHFCAARGIDRDTATLVPSQIRQSVCSFVDRFGFEDKHPFIKSLAEKVLEQADRYRILTKKSPVNVENLVRLAISVFYLRMRPLGVREVTFIETGNEYNESTMDNGDDDETIDEVEICWFPLVLAEELETQTLVTKAKVINCESSEVGRKSDGDIVYGRQWPLEIWEP